MKAINDKNFKSKMVKRLITRSFVTLTFFSIGLALFLLVILFLGNRYMNSPDLPAIVYTFLIMTIHYPVLVYLLLWGIGFVVITLIYLVKTLGYVNKMTMAINTIYEDDTDLVHLPEELNDVEDRLNQLKYEFFRNQQIAKEAEQRKNDLVVYLAHDLKTPLTSIIGYMTLLRDEDGISEELRKKYISISLKKAERLEDLINEFFEITRFNLTNMALEKTTFNLARMLEQIIFEFNPLFQSKNLTCSLEASKEVLFRGDVEKLERVFDNLIRNAISYSFDNSEIKVVVEENEEGISLKFINEGNTIPEGKLNRIFEQFYRLDTARTTKAGGAGLGLAITKKIIELHDGKIDAWSDEQLIKFEITLPRDL